MDAVAVMEMGPAVAMPAPSFGRFAQERSTKPVKEASAAAQERSTKPVEEASAAALTDAEAAAIIEAGSEARAGTKAEVGMANPAEGKKKRTKMVRVQQGYIDALLMPYPFEPLPMDPEELMKSIKDPSSREWLRALMAPTTAVVKAIRDKDEAIIKQYLAQGYAEEEVEVSDGDSEQEAQEDDGSLKGEDNNHARIVATY